MNAQAPGCGPVLAGFHAPSAAWFRASFAEPTRPQALGWPAIHPLILDLIRAHQSTLIFVNSRRLAERRAQALLVDPAQLRELLGEVELRELLDAGALEQVEAHLQHLAPERAARHPDALHDLLIRLGDLTVEEVRARCCPVEAADAWIAQLARERRIARVLIAGEERLIAVEDAGRFRDALGVPPPAGLPAAFLEHPREAVGDLVARHARTHGPFHAEDLAERLGLGIGPVLTALRRHEEAGRIVQGEFRPGGRGVEWCDSGVLRAIRQKSLARLRREVEPVDQAALGRLYLAWQGVEKDWGPSESPDRPPRRSKRGLLDVVEQLQGAAIPASVLEAQVLPARLPDYDPREIDMLLSSGSVIWMGAEPLGARDGRIRLLLAEHAALLAPSAAGDPRLGEEGVHARIRAHLRDRGASFYPQIAQAVGGFGPEVLEALWDLVWAGEVTNDTLQPLRAFLSPRRGGRRTEGPRRHEAARRWRASTRVLGASLPRQVPPEAAGRWSLVSSLVLGSPTPTARMAAQAHQLLDRCGVLTREAVQAEGIAGGFSALYGVLKAMEESGQARRGYFVAGLGATQFAVPGALDRLRGLREPPRRMESVLISAADPANPYGAAVPWPERADGRRPARSAGAQVLLVDGALAGWIGRSERELLTFVAGVPDREPEEVRREIARALAREVEGGRRRAVWVQDVDGMAAVDSPMARALMEAGFLRTLHGFLRRL